MRVRNLLYLLLALILGLQIQCTVPTSVDVVPPTVQFVYPYSASVLAGEQTVVIESADNREIVLVWFYLDGEVMAQSTKRAPRFTVDFSPWADNQQHFLIAAAKDKDGNIGYGAPVNVVISDNVDNIPPIVQIVNPQSGQTVEDTVHVVASAFDERLVREVAFFVNGDSVLSDSIYPYAYDWPVGNLADSTNHTILAKAWDAGDNWTISAPVTVTVFPRVDRVPPVATLVYPVSGQVLFGTVEVVVDAQDITSVIQRVVFYVDGDSVTQDLTEPYTFMWNTDPIADNQQHSLYYKAIDGAGNVSVNPPVSFTISSTGTGDNVFPTATLLYPVSGQILFGTVDVVVDAKDNFGVERVVFYVDGDSVTQDTSEPYGFAWDTDPIADNFSHSLYFKAVDFSGNESAGAPVSFTVSNNGTGDIVLPTASLVYPVTGQILFGTVDVVVEATDNNGVERVVFFVDGDSVTQDTSEPYGFAWNTDPIADNFSHSLFFKAVDFAGNESVGAPLSFTISGNGSADITPPTAQITYPLAGTTLSGTNTVFVDAFDAVGVDHVEFFVDGVSQFTDNGAPWSFDWDTTPYADGGSHALFVKAFDAAGNVGNSATVTYIVAGTQFDLIPPTVLLLYPLSGSPISGTVAVAVDANDNNGVTKVEFYVDGVLTNTDNAAPWGFSWNTAPWAGGLHTLYIKAYDAAGNTGSQGPVTFTIN